MCCFIALPSQGLLIPIFLLTYLGIAATRVPFLRLDRPAAALAGAVALLATGLFSLEDAFAFVDWNVIAFLFGMMVTIAYLEIAGFFAWAAHVLLRVSGTPRRLLWSTLVGCALLSAFFVNDTICLLLTPILLRATRAARLPALPFLIAIATASNIGSALTITGNPQNMLIGIHSGIPFLRFMAVMAVPVLLALVLDGLLLSFVFREQLATRPLDKVPEPSERLDTLLCAKALLGLLLTLGLFVAKSHFYPQAALVGATLCVLTARVPTHQVWRKLDWTILLFFAGLFVVMGAFRKVGYLDSLLDQVRPMLAHGGLTASLGIAGLAAVLSNLVSNVPAVILLEPLARELGGGEALWMGLALGSTLAGNFTLIASVANLIVAEKAAAEGERLPFFAYLKVGLPVSVVTMLVGILWLHGVVG